MNVDIIRRLFESMDSMETPACSDQSREHHSHFISLALTDMSNMNRAGSEANNSRSLIGSLSCCLTQWHRPPIECDYHSVQAIPSTVRSPPSPAILFTYLHISLYLFHLCSIHSDFISSKFSPLSLSITKMSTSGAAGCLLTQEPRGTQLSS